MRKLNTCTTLITIYIQILKLFCFFNQFIVVTSQKPFSFQVIFHAFIWQSINTPIIKSIFNNYDDFVQVFHLKTTWSQNCQYPNKTKHAFRFQFVTLKCYKFVQHHKCHIWKLPFVVAQLNKRSFTCR